MRNSAWISWLNLAGIVFATACGGGGEGSIPSPAGNPVPPSTEPSPGVTPGVLSFSAGVAEGDYDWDGYLDLFVGAAGGDPVFVFQNHGDGTGPA